MHAEGIVVESDPVGSGEDPAAYAGDVDGVGTGTDGCVVAVAAGGPSGVWGR